MELLVLAMLETIQLCANKTIYVCVVAESPTNELNHSS